MLRWLVPLCAAALSACSASPAIPRAPLSAADGNGYRDTLAGAGTRYAIDAAASQLSIHVFRGGRAARLGHNHVLGAPQLEGRILVPDEDPTQTQFSLRLRLDQLEVDAPGARQRTGGNFAAPRSASDVEGTRRNLLKSLDADRYPDVVINSRTVAGDWPVFVAELAVTLHGVTRSERVPLQVSRNNDTLHVRGALALRQSDYGITPYSVLGGVLTVQDALAIEFALQARAESAR